jgi:methylthioribose-1-phosphate isomerase
VAVLPPIEAVRWNPAGDAVRIIDQRLLPECHEERDLRTLEEVVAAIRSLSVRGAPAIGICAAMGLAVVTEQATPDGAGFQEAFRHAARTIREARPTAVNLAWAIDRLVARVAGVSGRAAAVALLREEATTILAEDRAMCRAIGEHGAALLTDGVRVLTHCNAGALATGGIGTALAPVYVAHERGGRVAVIAGETRPLLQGSRLTAWELSRAGIPVTVIADNMVGSVMRGGQVDLCLVGADRIAANGDVANKIGTYGIAVLAKHHGIPLYVAAPTSTIDPATPTGAGIEIEQRDPAEVASPFGVRVAPGAAAIYNPAFDVTPAELVTAIITDRGIFRHPYDFR